MTIPEIDKDFLRKQLPDFARQTADYHNEKIGKIAYKEFSGYFGSFAQRDGKKQYAAPALQCRSHNCR